MEYRLKIVYKNGKIVFHPTIADPAHIFSLAHGWVVIDDRGLIDYIDLYKKDKKIATFYK